MHFCLCMCAKRQALDFVDERLCVRDKGIAVTAFRGHADGAAAGRKRGPVLEIYKADGVKT